MTVAAMKGYTTSVIWIQEEQRLDRRNARCWIVVPRKVQRIHQTEIRKLLLLDASQPCWCWWQSYSGPAAAMKGYTTSMIWIQEEQRLDGKNARCWIVVPRKVQRIHPTEIRKLLLLDATQPWCWWQSYSGPAWRVKDGKEKEDTTASMLDGAAMMMKAHVLQTTLNDDDRATSAQLEGIDHVACFYRAPQAGINAGNEQQGHERWVLVTPMQWTWTTKG
jgi:hypothetical protein